MPSLTSVLVKQFDLYKRIDQVRNAFVFVYANRRFIRACNSQAFLVWQDFVRSTCSSTSFSIFSIVITTVLLYLEITGFMAVRCVYGTCHEQSHKISNFEMHLVGNTINGDRAR